MKGLSIEEKAARYDKAIERANELNYVSDKDSLQRKTVEHIFPELKESEGERIRKWLIYYFKEVCDNISEKEKKGVLAWLEKQKPNLPKWKYKNGNAPLLRDSLILNKYGRVAKSPSGAVVSDVWVIDYDELAKLPKEETEKQDDQKLTQEINPFEIEHGKYYYCIKDYFCGGKKQASKGNVVQALRGLPIMGLKNASEYFLPVNFINCNSSWSDEDEKIYNRIYGLIHDAAFENYDVDEEGKEFGEYARITNWLKSVKERVQQQRERSKEDVKIIKEVIQLIEDGALSIEEKTYYIDRLRLISSRQ